MTYLNKVRLRLSLYALLLVMRHKLYKLYWMLFGHVLAPLYLLVYFGEVFLFKNNSPWNTLPGTFYSIILFILMAMVLFNVIVTFKWIALRVIGVFSKKASGSDLKTGAIVHSKNVQKNQKLNEDDDIFDNISVLPGAADIANVYWDDLYGDD